MAVRIGLTAISYVVVPMQRRFAARPLKCYGWFPSRFVRYVSIGPMTPKIAPYPTFVVTARLDSASFLWLEGLRKANFPRELNFLSAHLTIFHKLTADQIERLSRRPMPGAPLRLDFSGPRLLGQGVAIDVTSPALADFRSDAARQMGELSRQDAAGWRPHVTIQNKTTPEIAHKLYEDLSSSRTRRQGEALGLQIWQYLGGPWAHKAELPFSSDFR